VQNSSRYANIAPLESLLDASMVNHFQLEMNHSKIIPDKIKATQKNI
jgi:hypothetical protein